MSSRISTIDTDWPWWADFRALLGRIGPGPFPDAGALTGLLPDGAVNRRGRPLRFVAAGRLPGVAYEKHIFEHGEISTREGDWHDLFNALVWCRLPRLKAAMNALHYEHLGRQKDGRRGRMRDALTLLDESGAVVVSAERDLLEALARRDWQRAFRTLRSRWAGPTRVIVCGHALLEKMLDPYKAITAHALLLHYPAPPPGGPRAAPLRSFDLALSERLLTGGLLASPADLSPLPLMGIPGWWRDGQQDAAFYSDSGVFRPRRIQAATASRLIQDM